MSAILSDNYLSFESIFRKECKLCQSRISPAEDFHDFLTCLRKIVLDPLLRGIPAFGGVHYGDSFLSTYQPTTYPPMTNGSEYDVDYPLLRMVDETTGEVYEFKVDFEPLGNEEHLSNFEGADPYFDDNFSPYRYRFNSYTPDQHQPGWSYRGLHGSKEWHTLDLDRFYLPLQKKASSDKVNRPELVADFAQTYPGIGELAEGLEKLDTPLDYRWTKDSGYEIYTRYLIPLFQKDDLDYYKSKGLIETSVTHEPDVMVLEDIIDGLGKYENESADLIALKITVDGATPNPKFPTGEDAPFADAYFKFIQQFYGVDLAQYKSIKEKLSGSNSSYNKALEMEVIRKILRAYVQVVKAQEHCVQEMVKTSEYRVEDLDELQKVYERAIAANETCRTAPTREDAVNVRQLPGGLGNDPDDWEFKLPEKELEHLYNDYFNRKDSRQRYSLPKYPVEFPICRSTDPSPIDIRTHQTRQSSIKNYVFGASAYRLNRFFMFFPLDGSNYVRYLWNLTLGIVDGERLDDSSVRLSEGAIRGQNLTFQYMHIKFADDWKGIGSDHWINGEGAPMELQMVFTIAGSADPIKYWHIFARIHNKLYQFREKLVVILSVLVNVFESDEAVEEKIKEDNLLQDPYVLEPLAQAAYHFRSMPEKYPTFEQPRGWVSVDPVFRFIDFIPRTPSKFYTYRGGLSWPPCFGYVLWSVYEQRLYISKRQFGQFANIPAYGVHETNYASNNFRRFDDIYVEEEHVPTLTYDMIEDLKRRRTVERSILVGYSEGTEGKTTKEEVGVVGEEIYFLRTSGCTRLLTEEGHGRNLFMMMEMIFTVIMSVQ